MKYIASLKLERDMSLDDIELSLAGIEVYQSENPPTTAEVFQRMDDLLALLGNERLLEQWCVAQRRCTETAQLLRLRRDTLRDARDRLTVVDGAADEDDAAFSDDGETMTRRLSDDVIDTWRLRTSTPTSDYSAASMSRRQSYAGLPSAPMCSPLYSGCVTGGVLNYQDYLLNKCSMTPAEGHTPEQAVSWLVAGPSDCAMRLSAESLNRSRDSLSGGLTAAISVNSRQNHNVAKSMSLPAGDVALRSMPTTTSGGGKHSRPRWKMFKKAVSMLIDRDFHLGDVLFGGEKAVKSISLRSDSVESLPRLVD